MTLIRKTLSALSFGMILLTFLFQANANDDWTWYHGNDSATRYSGLSDINTGNIGD